MDTIWIQQFLLGLGKLFLHPLFYYSLLLCLIMGYRRVKKERSDFKIRVESGYFELRNVWKMGLLIGLALSVISIVAGMAIPFAAVLVVGAVTVLFSLTLQTRLLSPAYTIGASIFILFFLYGHKLDIPFLGKAVEDMPSSLSPALAAVMGLMLVAEGILIKRNAVKGTSPELITSNRGMTVGSHVSSRLWLVPMFLFVPGGELSAPFEWWPVFHIAGDMHVAPLFLPFLIGFSQHVHGRLPEESIRMTANRVFILSGFVLLIAIASIWLPILTIVAAAVAVLGRESIHYFGKIAEQHLPFYFSKREHGVLILAVMPDSPAEKMALEVGELITKVNGTPVQTEHQLYEALQHNRAYCKLEVLDTNGQIRFVQRALFEGEHYELGILFLPEEIRASTA
ncbi:PDZ domain-containing protein [Bacillus sp. 1P06AnD]|uniref:PDZ domain-containing protein n=1 Tax=Bacillus sp. 1P06AnD TaxID=3132208 RepID=UPI00399EF4F9